MQALTTIGLDIAKPVFQVHRVDAHGKVVGVGYRLCGITAALKDLNGQKSIADQQRQHSCRPQPEDATRGLSFFSAALPLREILGRWRNLAVATRNASATSSRQPSRGEAGAERRVFR